MAGKVRPGQPGNSGRPKGSKNKRRALLDAHQDELLQKLIDMALRGDPTALRLCIDRLLPRLRPQTAPIQVDAPGGSVSEIGEAVVQSAINGKISPDAARDVLAALSDVARLKEFTELESRLAMLEEGQEKPPWETQSPAIEKLPLRSRKRRRSQCEET